MVDKKTTTKNSDLPTKPEENNSNYLWKIWDQRDIFTIPDTQLTIKGYSIAALRTNFYIKELCLLLDAGLSSPFGNEAILLTHGHADHSANLPFHIFNRKENSKIKIYCPNEIKGTIKNFIESAYIMSSDVDFEKLNIKNDELYIHGFYTLIGVSDKEILELPLKNKK